MGLPVQHLIVATNSNDILDRWAEKERKESGTQRRFFTTGSYDKSPVQQTFSPSMDIGISSNFERYLFYLFDEDSKILAHMMDGFNKTGRLSVDQAHVSSHLLSVYAPPISESPSSSPSFLLSCHSNPLPPSSSSASCFALSLLLPSRFLSCFPPMTLLAAGGGEERLPLGSLLRAGDA
eukprot:544977-Hanusia_phi.AAC.1